MGSKEIWILASVAYGLLSGLIYALIARYRRYNGNFIRRFIVWSVVYTLFALALASLLWHYLAE